MLKATVHPLSRDDIRRLGLCEVIRCHEGGAFMNGISIFTWDSRELAFSLSAVHIMRLQGEIGSLGKKRVLTRTWPSWHPDLGLPISGTARNTFMLFLNACMLLPWAFTKHFKKLLAEVREVCKMVEQKNDPPISTWRLHLPVQQFSPENRLETSRKTLIQQSCKIEQHTIT